MANSFPLLCSTLSSMKTGFAGSRSSWPSNQARRRLRMSGRSCSSACADFFVCPAAPAKPVAQGAATDPHRSLGCQPLHHLVQRDVLALIDQPDNEGFMRIETGSAASACGRGVRSPIFARAIHRIALDIPAPNRAAACRADMPSSEAFKTRDRRSLLSALAIVHL